MQSKMHAYVIRIALQCNSDYIGMRFPEEKKNDTKDYKRFRCILIMRR